MNREIRKLRQSFACSFRGVSSCLRTERNFRIHLTAVCYVSMAALLAELDAVRCAVLCLCFAVMLASELLNTAVERLCDRQTTSYDKLVREAPRCASRSGRCSSSGRARPSACPACLPPTAGPCCRWPRASRLHGGLSSVSTEAAHYKK